MTLAKNRDVNLAGEQLDLYFVLCRAGQSNPTFLLQTSSDSYVLRKKPPGMLLPGAHKVTWLATRLRRSSPL